MFKREDTVYLKGIGILLIIFHNYFHNLNGAPGENEFAFYQTPIFNLINNLIENPFDIAKQFFSFFGHYGVQIFVFLSGYGLAISYKKQLSFFSFIKKRWLKIFPLLLGAMMIYVFPKIFYVWLWKNDIPLTIQLIKSSLLKLTFLANYFPGETLRLCGPWWFFSLIFQLYLLFPVLIKLKKEFLLVVIFFSWTIQLIVLGFFDVWYTEYLRYNFLGHLPEFCLGIYFVKCKIEKINPFVFLFSILMFCLSCVNQYFWVFSFFTIPLIVIYLYQIANINGSRKFHKIVMYFGYNSMYLFAVHGFLRKSFFDFANSSTLFSIVTLPLYLLASLIVAHFLKLCLKKVDKIILKT